MNINWDRVQRIASLTRALVWVALLPLAYQFGWIKSVAFVALCSLYANAASDFAAYRADSNKAIDDRLDRIEALLQELIDKQDVAQSG
jgi:hypothetical protein